MSGYGASITNEITKLRDFGFYNIQAVPVFCYRNLTLDEGGSIKPSIYNNYTGGILCIFVKDTLTFNGGHIDLTDKGIQPGQYNDIRPLTSYEKDIGDPPSSKNLPLNIGDGLVCIFAKKIVFNSNKSRIGNINTSGGKLDNSNPYSTDGLTQLTTNIGGSTVLIVCETIVGFDPTYISNFRNISSNESNYRGKGSKKVVLV